MDPQVFTQQDVNLSRLGQVPIQGEPSFLVKEVLFYFVEIFFSFMIFQLNATELSSLINMISNVLLITHSSPPPQVSDGKHPPRYTMFTINVSPMTLSDQCNHRSPDCILATRHTLLSKLAPIGTFSYIS